LFSFLKSFLFLSFKLVCAIDVLLLPFVFTGEIKMQLLLLTARSRLWVAGVGQLQFRPCVTGRRSRVGADEDFDGVSSTSTSADVHLASVQRPTATEALRRRPVGPLQLLRVWSSGAERDVVESRRYNADQQQANPHYGLLLAWLGSPKGATSFLDRGSYECDQIRVRLCLFCLVV